jgi:hypothetical protein
VAIAHENSPEASSPPKSTEPVAAIAYAGYAQRPLARSIQIIGVLFIAHGAISGFYYGKILLDVVQILRFGGPGANGVWTLGAARALCLISQLGQIICGVGCITYWRQTRRVFLVWGWFAACAAGCDFVLILVFSFAALPITGGTISFTAILGTVTEGIGLSVVPIIILTLFSRRDTAEVFGQAVIDSSPLAAVPAIAAADAISSVSSQPPAAIAHPGSLRHPLARVAAVVAFLFIFSGGIHTGNDIIEIPDQILLWSAFPAHSTIANLLMAVVTVLILASHAGQFFCGLCYFVRRSKARRALLFWVLFTIAVAVCSSVMISIAHVVRHQSGGGLRWWQRLVGEAITNAASICFLPILIWALFSNRDSEKAFDPR